MKLFIIDSGIVGRWGHNFAFANMIAEEARRRQVKTVAWCHAAFRNDGGLPFVPVGTFSSSYYAQVSLDPITGAWHTFDVLNQKFLVELRAAFLASIATGDLVLIPTINENQLDGLLKWIAEINRDDVTFVIILMLPSGVRVHGDKVTVYDPLRALRYRFLLSSDASKRGNVHLLATGDAFSRDYSFLAERSVPPHPLLVGIGGSPTLPTGKTILLHAGDAFDRKGVQLLPAVVRMLSHQLPDWKFLIHANDIAGGSNKAAVAELRALQQTVAGLDLRSGYLDPAGYQQLFRESACVVMPYSSTSYSQMSSGILWEAIAAGRQALVPSGSYLEREAHIWGAEYRAVDTSSAASLAAGIVASIGAMDAGRALEAAARFRAVNGVERFMDAVIELR